MTNDVKQTIDWGKPIEAVHEDGRVSKAVFKPLGGKRMVDIDAIGAGWYVSEDGDVTGEWRIRNVTPADTAPEWGPPIPVDGKRPEWLQDKDYICWINDDGFEHGPDHPSQQKWSTAWTADSLYGWNDIRSIRLPANHPYYARTPTIPAALVERMVGLVRRMAALGRECFKGDGTCCEEDYAEACDIVDLIGPKIDPDLIKARGIAAELYEAGDNVSPEHRAEWAKYCRNGAYDNDMEVKAALAGIKAGREMGA